MVILCCMVHGGAILILHRTSNCSRQFEVVAKRSPHFVTRSRVLYCLNKYKISLHARYCSPTDNYTDIREVILWMKDDSL